MIKDELLDALDPMPDNKEIIIQVQGGKPYEITHIEERKNSISIEVKETDVSELRVRPKVSLSPTKVMRQYATTGALLVDKESGYSITLDVTHVADPIPPDNTSTWDLKGSIEHNGRVLWFWQRDVESS